MQSLVVSKVWMQMANRKIQKISVEYFNTVAGLKNKGLNPRQMDVKYVNV